MTITANEILSGTEAGLRSEEPECAGDAWATIITCKQQDAHDTANYLRHFIQAEVLIELNKFSHLFLNILEFFIAFPKDLF